MPEKPLLILPEPGVASKHRPFGGAPDIHFPTPRRQRDRFDAKFAQLDRIFRRRAAQLRRDLAGVEPEQVLVLETAGSVEEFYEALRRTEGLEWLGDWARDDLPPNEDFYRIGGQGEESLSGRLFLILYNRQGLNELLGFWEVFKSNPSNPRFSRGFAKWGHIFKQLRDIHLWGPQDRLRETGLLEDWNQRVAAGEEVVRIQIELWHRSDANRRDRSETILRRLIQQEGGEVIGRASIDEIAYHAILARLPIQSVERIVRTRGTHLVQCDQVMFFRPNGQAVTPAVAEEAVPGPEPPEGLPLPAGDPVTALLDGLPIENHNWLHGRLRVDDPDNWAAAVPSERRFHGTAMSSLVIHGELDASGPPLSRPVYIRPVLRPDPRRWTPPGEFIPEEFLPVDLVHRAIRRLFDGEGALPAVAPTVKVVNLSVGDQARPFDNTVSPWARLLDYLAWRYRVLFVVSAGNHHRDIELDGRRQELSAIVANPDALEARALRGISRHGALRRLLSPAESVDALTVGSIHGDGSTFVLPPTLVNPFHSPSLPSPLNPLGSGFRRAIKPDVLFSGGRQLYRGKLGNAHSPVTLEAVQTTHSPGQRVAYPGRVAGDLGSTAYTRGTSNAAALVTRAASQLYDVLIDLRHEPGGDRVQDEFIAILMKAMIVHSAAWGEAAETIVRHLGGTRDAVARFLGYGTARVERLFDCTDQRATLVGCAKLGDGEAHRYFVPLPPSLSGQRIFRRLVVTLAWLTPINPKHSSYRRAHLWFDPYGETREEGALQNLLNVRRKDVDWRAARRGTVQHEIFEGEQASSFSDGDQFCVQVNCRAEAGELADAIPYAIAATLEVAPGVAVPVYEEIRERVLQRIGIPVGATAYVR